MHDIFQSELMRILVVIWSALVMQIISRFVISKLIDRSVGRRQNMSAEDAKKQRKTLKGVLGTVIAVLIWIIAFFIVITILGVNVAALLAGAGLFGVVFGFGAQGVVKDFVSGFFILGENQYRVGDTVEITTSSGLISGTVEDLTIRITRLRDLDGNMLVVSNGLIQSIKNYSFQYANVNVNLRVAYDSDIDKVQKVIDQVGKAMAADDVLKKDIVEPIEFLRIDAFEDFGIVVKALGKVKPGSQWHVAAEFRRRINGAFKKEKIIMPIPQVYIPKQNTK